MAPMMSHMSPATLHQFTPFSRSLPLRPARVHGGGEAGELKDVLRAVSVVCGDFVVIEYRAYHVGVYGGRPQRFEACPTLCLASCFSDLMPLLSPRAVGLVRPQRPLLGMNRDRRCEQGEQGEHDESHHSVPSTAAGPCASLAHRRNLPHRSSPLRCSHSDRSACCARDLNSRDSPRTEHFMCGTEACFV